MTIYEEVMQEGMIFHGPGGCPICSGPLAVLDSEMTFMNLNSKGEVVGDENVSIHCIGKCMDCGHTLDMIRWKGGYVPFNRASLILKTMEIRDLVEERKKEIRGSVNSLAIEVNE